MFRSPPLFSSLPPTIRAILAQGPPQGPSSSQTQIRGWVKSIRAHKNVAFAAITDGSSSESLQAVIKGLDTSQLTVGSSVELHGEVAKSKGRGQAIEFSVKSLKLLGECDPTTYPIQKKHLPEHVLREQAHLRFRAGSVAAVTRVRAGMMREWHDWFEENEFTHIHTPILTTSDCEGAGEVFTLVNKSVSHPESVGTSSGSTSTSPPTFFPSLTHLTVSSQLHLEAPTHSLSRTYTLSPAFRAEPSLTSRHLAEFYMMEAEVGFIARLDDLLDIVENGIRDVLRRSIIGEGKRGERFAGDLGVISEDLIEESGEEEVNKRKEELRAAAKRPFNRLSYTQAIDVLAQQHETKPFPRAPKWGQGLSSDHERWLATHLGGPTFVTHYPKSLKPFYMLPSSVDPAFDASVIPGETVACFDLLLPSIGELAGGSLREHRLAELVLAMKQAGLREEEYEWYLDLRRYGSIPHGGWGMGWERWLCWVTGVGNVRDVVAFPRWFGHCKY